jgi:hypothetical protein
MITLHGPKGRLDVVERDLVGAILDAISELRCVWAQVLRTAADFAAG